MSDVAEDGYDGPAELVLEAQTLRVQVSLRGVFQPIDGKYHWYGRLARQVDIDDAVGSGGSVVLRTAQGHATARLSDIDPWGRFRVSGTGRPPFELPEMDF